MTISQKIIFSSTLVACLAALAAYMGWKNTHPIQQGLVKTLTHTSEEIQFLNDIKKNTSAINTDIQNTIKTINNDEVKDLKKYSEKARLLDIRVKSLKVQIQAFKEFNKTPNTKEQIETILHLSEVLREQTRILLPKDNHLPSPVIALEAGMNTRETVQKLETQITRINDHRFSLIKAEGEVVNEQISKLNFWIILIGSLTFLMAIVFGQLIARNLSQEIGKLRLAASQLNKGDYTARVGSKSNDEFGKLGRTFDGMAANLEQAKTIEAQKTKMEQLNLDLKIKNDALDSFVYRVSHDLKAPIVNIKSLLSLIKLKMSKSENDEVKQSFFFLEKSADKLDQTILDLLEVSRIEKNLVTKEEWVNLESMITKIMVENSENISSHHVEIKMDLNIEDLFFSKPNLDSILSNLISNGIKYSSPKRPSEVHIETTKHEDWVCLKISDNGIGLDLDKHGEKLFGMFNRFNNSVQGSGVGLYIVKKIIDNANGRIEVESKVDQGTSFSIYLQQQETPSNVEALTI